MTGPSLVGLRENLARGIQGAGEPAVPWSDLTKWTQERWRLRADAALVVVREHVAALGVVGLIEEKEA